MARARPSLRERLSNGALDALFRIAVAAVRLGPLDGTIRAFAAAGRRLLPLAPASRRVRENLALARPDAGEAEIRALTAAVGAAVAPISVEYMRMAEVAPRADRRRTEGVEHLRAAMAGGRGALIVSAHYGNWEMVRLAARDAGVECGLILRGFDQPGFDAFAREAAALAGEPVLSRGAGGVTKLAKRLRAGGAMMILLDQRLSRSDPALPFLGAPAPTNVSAVGLAAKLGAAVLTARARRAADGLSFDIRFEPEIAADGGPEAMMRAVNARIGAWVEEEPGQWFWLHRRWMSRRALARRASAAPR